MANPMDETGIQDNNTTKVGSAPIVINFVKISLKRRAFILNDLEIYTH